MVCTDSSFAVNRENWEGVLDEGEEYIPANELVIDDISNQKSVKRYQMPEIFGISTSLPTSPNLTWIAAPIVALVVLLTVFLFILWCAFVHSLTPVDHSDTTTDDNNHVSNSLPPRDTPSPDRPNETDASWNSLDGEGGGGYDKLDWRGG